MIEAMYCISFRKPAELSCCWFYATFTDKGRKEISIICIVQVTGDIPQLGQSVQSYRLITWQSLGTESE